MVRGWESAVWMRPALLTPILLSSLGICVPHLPAMGWWALIWSSTAALMLSPISGSKSLLAGIQWLHFKPGQRIGSSVALQFCISWTSAQSPEWQTCASCICSEGTDAARNKTNKPDPVNLATIIQEVCGRAANKTQTFCLLGLCLHNNTLLPLGIWACCLIGRRCSACLLKGKGCWESHALIL